MMDMAHLEPIRWGMIAVDEAHHLKNKDRELHTSLAGLSSANRLLVSGTPPHNFVAELVGIAALVESRPV
jgi:ATP-dependent DNA helicase